jgi:hypothetical protein
MSESSLTLTGVVKELPTVLAEAAKLQNPVLDAAIVAEVVSLVSPFGVNVGPSGSIILGALVLVGTVATAVQKAIVALKPAPAPVPVGVRR